MKKVAAGFFVLAAALGFTACSSENAAIEQELKQMTLQEKVGSMFFVRPEVLDTDIYYDSPTVLKSFDVHQVTDKMKETARVYPMGGVILFSHNIKDPQQLSQFISDLRALPSHPLLCIDEEGGSVARLANNPNFHLPKFANMGTLAASGRTKEVTEAATTIGEYLKSYGFDIDFAPVADVNTNPRNVVIGARAFSNEPKVAAEMVKAYLKGLQKSGVIGCLKHFPGHGDTQADSHFGYAMSRKTWEEIRDCEMIPFKAGMEAGAQMIMTAHISLPNVTGSNVPSTLSPMILQEKLRGELGYKGLIITDAMEMGAILRQYPVEDAAVMAIKAGVDVLLCVREYPKVFDAVLKAVRRGEIPESRIDESV
ncbi:MAG: glycoside hydrolase, partial [Bacteroidales bacterium]|nr:glycoside hydrolase [Bacteroidales bacterium]